MFTEDTKIEKLLDIMEANPELDVVDSLNKYVQCLETIYTWCMYELCFCSIGWRLSARKPVLLFTRV